ncbi:hypothetical protein N617_gp17 [Stygiolobus rod-shaped virus]|uniref:Uncharacterized protein n=1 Tax=Stygiolobus rod-shaped virus TaxID=537009 RepID=B6EFC3_9VIRU|nr:hypothetical protein N617_gp17 [Stygiolobus rod-shaped virus]CAQ58458.1 hypothetical protein [Stygiolobus rod-shaped virus]
MLNFSHFSYIISTIFLSCCLFYLVFLCFFTIFTPQLIEKNSNFFSRVFSLSRYFFNFFS